MSKCNIRGCHYNEDGECLYNISPIKMLYERACYVMPIKGEPIMPNNIRVVPTSHPNFEPGTLFLVNNDDVIRIEECDDGWDFALYEPWSMKELDGGQLDRPDMTKEEAIREIYRWYYPEKSKEK